MLDIAFFRHDPVLCPVTSIQAYLDKTGPICGEIKASFIVLVGTIQPATKMTLNRWARSFMKEAGLGNFSVHSNLSTTATLGLLTGIPLDELISRVGWSHPSTFINHYLKPLHQFCHHFPAKGRNLPTAKPKSHSEQDASMWEVSPQKPAAVESPGIPVPDLVSSFQRIWTDNPVV